MTSSALLGDTGWFEDFAPGQRMRHARAATVDEIEGSAIAKGAARSLMLAGPLPRRPSTARRVGSASAEKMPFSCATC